VLAEEDEEEDEEEAAKLSLEAETEEREEEDEYSRATLVPPVTVTPSSAVSLLELECQLLISGEDDEDDDESPLVVARYDVRLLASTTLRFEPEVDSRLHGFAVELDEVLESPLLLSMRACLRWLTWLSCTLSLARAPSKAMAAPRAATRRPDGDTSMVGGVL